MPLIPTAGRWAAVPKRQLMVRLSAEETDIIYQASAASSALSVDGSYFRNGKMLFSALQHTNIAQQSGKPQNGKQRDLNGLRA